MCYAPSLFFCDSAAETSVIHNGKGLKRSAVLSSLSLATAIKQTRWQFLEPIRGKKEVLLCGWNRHLEQTQLKKMMKCRTSQSNCCHTTHEKISWWIKNTTACILAITEHSVLPRRHASDWNTFAMFNCWTAQCRRNTVKNNTKCFVDKNIWPRYAGVTQKKNNNRRCFPWSLPSLHVAKTLRTEKRRRTKKEEGEKKSDFSNLRWLQLRQSV